ncbi:MAG: haloalkane dehalogenase [Mycobacterium sp.]|jgi:pimeloyl-ACP methyl ester carboxylesterase|nr:haloalkane dehalogenase [Mycobacterium sp.]MDT5281070.1 haloalkane dehalogenase [Mycobacterium sp.]
MGENLPVHQLLWLGSNERADDQGAFARCDHLAQRYVRHYADIRTADGHFSDLLPGLIPTTPDDPASEANRAAWKVLCDSATPMLVAFSDGDPITGAMAGIFASQMRGAQDIDHPVIANAGHFLQEDAGEELAEAIVRFLRQPGQPFCRFSRTL